MRSAGCHDLATDVNTSCYGLVLIWKKIRSFFSAISIVYLFVPIPVTKE